MTTTMEPINAPAASLPRKTVTQMLHLDKYSALYLWAGFMIVFGLSQDSFISKPTFITVLNEKVVIGVLALAFLIPLAAETFDLSIGNMMAFSVVITDVLTKNTSLPPGINAVIAILACAAFAARAAEPAVVPNPASLTSRYCTQPHKISVVTTARPRRPNKWVMVCSCNQSG